MKWLPFVFCFCLCIGFSCAAWIFASRADAAYGQPRYSSEFTAGAIREVHIFFRAESIGNARAFASLSRVTRSVSRNLAVALHWRAKPHSLKTRIAALPAALRAKPIVYLAITRIPRPAVALQNVKIPIIDAAPAKPITLQSVPKKARSAGYVNYDFFASPQNAYGNFGYGMRVGRGVAQVSALARPMGDDRGIMLSGFAWRYQSNLGNTLIIGDAQSRQGKYEESVRFDGIQYAGQNVSYDVGWERTDFGNSAMHFGQFMTQAAAWKQVGPRFTGEAHLFADSGTKLLALGGTWTTPHSGQLSFGIAPSSEHGLTGYFGYTLTTPRLRVTLDDRIWGAQSTDIGELVPANYRQLQADVQYTTSPTTKLHFRFASQIQNGFNVHSVALGYAQKIDGTDLHVDFTQSGSAFARNSGLVTYFSLPLGGGRSLTAQNTLTGGTAAKVVSLKQDVAASGVGTSYAIDFGRNGTSFTDATVTSRTLGSTTQIQLSRFGGPLLWSSEFSGSIVFFGGTPFAANQQIDQSNAFDTLKGRSSATLSIVNERGSSLPVGSIVRAIGEDGSWRVDEDGRVSITDVLTGPQTLLVNTGATTCLVGIVLPPNMSGSYDLGKQICR